VTSRYTGGSALPLSAHTLDSGRSMFPESSDTTKGSLSRVRGVTLMANEIVETLEAIEPKEGCAAEGEHPSFGGDTSRADLSSVGPGRWVAWGCWSGTTDLGRISV
jgi:hypothetical protein